MQLLHLERQYFAIKRNIQLLFVFQNEAIFHHVLRH